MIKTLKGIFVLSVISSMIVCCNKRNETKSLTFSSSEAFFDYIDTFSEKELNDCMMKKPTRRDYKIDDDMYKFIDDNPLATDFDAMNHVAKKHNISIIEVFCGFNRVTFEQLRQLQ